MGLIQNRFGNQKSQNDRDDDRDSHGIDLKHLFGNDGVDFSKWFNDFHNAHGGHDNGGHGNDSSIALSLLATFDSGLGEASAEIVAHDPQTQRLFVTNADAETVDILDISDPKHPTKVGTIDVSVIDGVETGGPNSVAVAKGIIAVAVEADDAQAPGLVAFYDADGTFLGSVGVGALPDMLVFTPDGKKILVANEGEPDGSDDPKGSVSIIDISHGVAAATVKTADFTAFDSKQAWLEAKGLRIFDGKVLSDDVEPEYIAISEDGKTAFVTLQEANAVAVLDIQKGKFVEIQPLGAKDYSKPGNGFDASDRDGPGDDGAINIASHPVFGLYMPDAIASYESKGKTYYVTANEGDDRGETARIKDLDLDPTKFPNAAVLQDDNDIGRLAVSTIDGDTDGDGDYDKLYAYGARSFTIWDEDGKKVFDSGDMIEKIIADLTPELFNADEADPDEFDTRSDAKGLEPEAVVVGEVNGKNYAFVGLERAGGGILVFDIDNPKHVEFVQYIRTDSDIAPEGLDFISAKDSPIGVPLLAVANEVSGTTSIYQINFDGKTIVGSNKSETLHGTGGDDIIDGRGGNDKVFGFAGNDDLKGGDQKDKISGGFGDDNVSGGKGNDELHGDQGDDEIDGGKGDDKLFGDDGDDRMLGGAGNDQHDGGAGMDTVAFSGNRNDYLVDLEHKFVVDLRSGHPDGTDDFANVEYLEFADMTISVSAPAAYTLQLLHASDLEGGVDAIARAANFAAIVDMLEDQYANSITLAAGDTFIAGPFYNAAGDATTFNPIFEGFYNEFFGLIDLSLVDPSADTNGDSFYDNGELNTYILANGLNASDVYVTDVNGDGFPDYFDEIDNFEGRIDLSIMNIIGFDASALGNHEFDLGSDALENYLNFDSAEANSLSGVSASSIIDEFGAGAVNYLQEVDWPGAQFPYLSANLNFSADADLGPQHTDDILPNTAFLTNLLNARANSAVPTDTSPVSIDPKIAPATIIERGGDYIGVVGATTQVLETISSPTGTTVIGGPFTTDDMVQLASVLQPVIDDLIAGDAGSGRPPVNKIILTSHLQQIDLEKALAGLLHGVDIMIAGGSDTLLADSTDPLRPGDVAAGDYPFETTNADGDPVLIMSTDGEYSYVGRLVVDFDANGVIIPGSVDPNVSGAYKTDDAGVLAVTGAPDIDTAIASSEKATDVEKLTDAVQGVVTTKDGNVFGETDVYIDGVRGDVRTQETNLGDLTADANLAVAKSVDNTVLVSVKNGGGIRASIGEVDMLGNELPTQANPVSGKEAGEISQLDIENSLRFNNGLTLITLTPEQLLQVLEHAVAAVAPGATPGQFGQFGGINFSYDPSQPAGSRVQSAALVDELGNKTAIVQNGDVVDGAPSAIRVVTLNFLADGGDNYPFDDFIAADAAFANRVDLLTLDPSLIPGALNGNANFANFGSEQDALAEHLVANHPAVIGPDGPSDFMAVETDPADDTRIQNLAGRADTVLDGAVFPGPELVINEIRIDQTGTDNDEYFELFGDPNMSLDGLTYIVIGDGSAALGSGVIEAVVNLNGQSIDGSGYFVAAESTFTLGTANLTLAGANPINFENSDNFTHLLVRDFTGAGGADLDTNDDGILDSTPWSEIVDSVALIGTAASELVYSTTQVGPDGSFVPGHVYRSPDGGPWQIGLFDPAALGASDTPGVANPIPGAPIEAAIYQIQGAAHRSPLEGNVVRTSGIVTAIAANGFYMQDATGDGNIATSDGLFVFTSSAPAGIALGDGVEVEGTVQEFQFGSALSVTEIVSPTTTVMSSGNALPDTVVLGVDRIQPNNVIDDDGLANFDPTTDAIDFLESLEGMRIEVNNPLVVAGTNAFDEVTLAANRGGESGPGILNAVVSEGDFNPEILLTDDILVTEPNATTGDTFAANPVGVLDYTFGAYKLQLTETPTVVSGGRTPDVTSLAGDATYMTVASYNVLNLDPNETDGDTDIANGRFASIADSIVNNLGSPDIIALQEIQDNTGSVDDGTVDADQTLQMLVDAIAAASGGALTYSFAFIAPTDNADGGQPGANIQNAFLYDASRVQLDSLSKIADDAFNEDGDGSPAQADYEGTRKPLVGAFTFLPTGDAVTVVGNHLKSKSQDDGLFGENQPPAEHTLAQRVDQAGVINDLVATIVSGDPNANVIVLGDMNDFQFSDTVDALKNGNGGPAELVNLIDTLPTQDQYSYIFNGNSQILDNLLISSNINPAAQEIDIVHVNLDFGAPFDNASDHDPVVARLDLSDHLVVV